MEFPRDHFYTHTIPEILKELKSSEKGLSDKEAKERLRSHGLNEIHKKKKASIILKLLKQFNSALIYILLVAMIISFIFDHKIDAYVILVVILVNASVGFIQERKAEKSIDALKRLIVSYAKVYRNNSLIKIPASKLVPGDIILLEEGDKVPADARLISLKNLQAQEASLTGESFPVEKNLKILVKDTSLGDQTNTVFMGTVIVSGEAKALVVSTGNQTAIGKVAKSLQEIQQPKLHFKEKVSQLSMQMAGLAIIGALLTFVIGFFIRDLEFIEIFLFTIASLVSGIPEGLPAVLIVVLAIGASRMAKRKALIRHLPAVESIGVATVITTDKTGTLTENSMIVEKIHTEEGEFNITGKSWEPEGDFLKDNKKINPLKFSSLEKLLKIALISNRSNLVLKEKNYSVVGDPTEAALLVLAKKSKIETSSKEKLIEDFSFSSKHKYRASLVESTKKEIYTIGAFEGVLNKCSFSLKSGKNLKLDSKKKKQLLSKAEEYAKQGMRVLALAYKDVSSNTNAFDTSLVNNLVFVGFVAMKDPVRPNIKESIEKANKAGIRVIMKTGDHKETALAIAKEIGLANPCNKVLTEQDLESFTDSEFKKAVMSCNIFARVTPEMKAKIVTTLQKQGEVVAMTGDGVNDAPALKSADIGVAMGIIGTDVAREASEIVLADDNFASIVNAVEEGRTVFRNIRRASFFLVTTNVAEDVTIVSSLALGFPLPMLPIQLLYLNLVTDTFNGMALSLEPSHQDVLNVPPKNRKEPILNRDLIFFLVSIAVLMAVITVPLFKFFLSQGLREARTVAFVSMSFFQLFNVLNLRSLKKSIFSLKPFSNKWVNLSLVASILMMLIVIYVPFFQEIFQFKSLSLLTVLTLILISSSVLIFGEIYKLVKRKRSKKHRISHVH